MSLTLSLLLAVAPTTAAADKAPPDTRFDQPVPAGKLSTANPRSIAAFLQKEGYRAKLVTDEGKPHIESAANGAKFYIYLENCKEQKDCQDVMFQSRYDKKEDDPVKVDAVNKYNADNRWARGYLDKDGEPVLEYDVLFTDQLIDEKMFGEALAIWSHALGLFHKAIDY
jgi:hypothetical protein